MSKTPLRPPIDCMYEPRQAELLPTPSGFIFTLKREMQRPHQSTIAVLEVDHTCQGTHYDHPDFGATYNEAEQVFVFFVGTSEDSNGSICPAAGKDKCKSFGKNRARAETLFLKKRGRRPYHRVEKKCA